MKRNRFRVWFLGVLLVWAMVAWATCTAQAASLLVYRTNDSGAGSLRQAILDNKNLGGGNTIIFSNVVTGTITLTTGELLITNNVAILGPGANVLAVNGNAASRVFHIGNGVTVTISGLTITNGIASSTNGGGIYNGRSTLLVSNCTLTGNSAGTSGGGIYNDGLAGRTGGSAALTVIASTFSGNSASYGGGIYNNADTYNTSATLTVVNSTLTGNSGTNGGGGIFNDGFSGSATLTVVNSTLTGNSAISGTGGGIFSAGFSTGSTKLKISASTLSDNSAATGGGGIYNDGGTLEIGNSILKTGTSGANILTNSGAVTSDGYNLSSDNGGGFLSALGDQINTDPMLGPMQNNGGPTPTMMPLPGSPAIDQGRNLGGLATDQRGRCRTYEDANIPNATGGDGTDIGAVEVSPAHTTVVGTTSDNGVSLRYCICDAQPGETVTFGVTGTITLTSGELLIGKSVNITGPTAAGVTVNGNNASRVFHIGSNTTATISGLSINNGAAIFGAGIYNDHSRLTLSNCTLTGNSAFNGSGNGGGIFNDGISGSATLTIANSTLSRNAAGAGGGIFNDGFSGSATLKISASTLSDNSANSGGGIYNQGASGSATLEIGDSILNTGTSGENILNNSGVVTSDGYNLSSDNGGGFLGALGDQINTDPMLGPLQNNGGPTFTMALRVGSPAIDKGKSFGLTTDQRGQPRPYDDPNIPNAPGGDGSDIGAYEASELRISAVQKVGNNLRLDFTSLLGANYEVQRRSDLVTGSWGPLAGSAPGNGGIASTTVSNAFNQSHQFYRIHTVP
jgi:hypothetical protein